MTDKILTKEMLQQMLHYNEATGHFTWLVTSNRKKAGERAGTPVPHGYRKIQVYGKIYYEHRLAWLYVHGAFPEEVVDHIDGFVDNNHPDNLDLYASNKDHLVATLTGRKGAAGTRSHRQLKYPLDGPIPSSLETGARQSLLSHPLGLFALGTDEFGL